LLGISIFFGDTSFVETVSYRGSENGTFICTGPFLFIEIFTASFTNLELYQSVVSSSPSFKFTLLRT
jgi:hypothetical protein